MARIQVLPPELANRIAAGEVVERPASVVKELLENALDAGARRIDVAVEDGGRRLIRVADDGCGMDEGDARLAFQQHATSKLSPAMDLHEVATHGFRGEALPAIAATASVVLVTAERDGEGVRVRVEHGRLLDVTSVGAPRGTVVEVRDLFARLPARRKFLRAPATELSHAARHVEVLALGAPGVHFTFTASRSLLDLPKVATPAERVAQVLGPAFAERAVHVAGAREGIELAAWLVPGATGLGRLGPVTLLVNGRHVGDRLLAHALREAGQALYGVDGMPGGVLMLTLPPGDVDVNVHPAKREVRFARPAQVHDAVRDLVLGRAAATSSFGSLLKATAKGGATPAMAALDRGGTGAPTAATAGWARDPAAPRDWGAVRSPAPAGARPAEARPAEARPAGAGPAPERAAGGSGWRLIGQHRNTFLLLEDDDGLVVVDQHCAHERVLYERLLAAATGPAPRQGLLQGEVVEVPRHLVPVLVERLPDLDRLGLEVEPFGDSSFLVRAVPEAAGTADPAELLLELAAQEDPAAEPLERVNRLAATIACKGAVKAGYPLGHEQARHLADQLRRCRVPTTCPHGRIAILKLSRADLDRRFGR